MPPSAPPWVVVSVQDGGVRAWTGRRWGALGEGKVYPSWEEATGEAERLSRGGVVARADQRLGDPAATWTRASRALRPLLAAHRSAA